MHTKPKLIKETNKCNGDDDDDDDDDDESFDVDKDLLLPGLPNDLAHLCLSSLSPTLLFSVSHAWRRLLYSHSFNPFYCLYVLLSPPPNSNANSIFASLDPLSSTWQLLPSPPQNPPLSLLHRHPSFLSRNLPIQTLTVSNHLILMSGTNSKFVPALSRPLLFHPETKTWITGPQFTTPRRWCATGSVGSTVFLASGVGSHYNGDVARSMEKWEMKDEKENWKWEKMAALKDGRFSREAVEAVGFRGKLCMVNVKGNALKDGCVFNVKENQWENMPTGMIAGWTGPAATMEEQVIYVVDEAKGTLNQYVTEKDCWRKVIELPEIKGAEQIVARRGKVCVVCKNGERIVVVDVVATPVPRVWVVEPPSGQQVVAIHILPRMSKYD